MLTVFPFLEWMCLYRFKDWLLGDLLAGLTVGLVQVPQGPFFLVSALMINVLKERPFSNGHLIMGTFVKDDFSLPTFYVNYNRSLSAAAISAYLAAVALHIILAQMTCIFGIMVSFHAGPVSFFYNIINYCIALPKANSTSILLFLTAVVALRINKCIRISFNRYPIEFPMDFVFPETPEFGVLTRIILQAMSLSLVSAFLVIALGRKIARFHDYRTNSNQDLIAIGLCNVVSSFFRSFVFTGAMARTIIQDKSGGRQQFASLVGAGVMVLLMAVLAGIVLSNVIPYLEAIYNLPSLWRQDQCDCVIWMVTFSSAIFLGLDVGLLISLVFAFFIITVRSHSEGASRGKARARAPKTSAFLPERRSSSWIVYTERYENKQEHGSSINLIRCSYLGNGELESETTSEEQIPHTVSSTSQKNLGHSYEDMKAWLPSNASRNSSLPPPEPSESLAQSRSRSVIIPYSESGLQTDIHTIILDFSMVHYVDSQALVVLRQMCNAFYNANVLVLISGCHTSVVKSFEKNDFFDEGITKAQLFLSLHDAVLFALSRKNPEPSELSADATETVIQETYSESDKNGHLSNLRYKTGSSIIEDSQRASPNFVNTHKPIKDLEFDLEPILNSEQNSGLGLDLDLDLNLDGLSRLDPESELESEIQAKSDQETEFETDAQTEPETEEEQEPERERKPQPRTRTRAHSPWRNYFSAYRFGASSSQSRIPPQTHSVERKQPQAYPDSRQFNEDTR
ncbi:hypothetical protein A6R68_22284, partial [Neotoma lepida]